MTYISSHKSRGYMDTLLYMRASKQISTDACNIHVIWHAQIMVSSADWRYLSRFTNDPLTETTVCAPVCF